MPQLTKEQKIKRGELIKELAQSYREVHPEFTEQKILQKVEECLSDPIKLSIINALSV